MRKPFVLSEINELYLYYFRKQGPEYRRLCERIGKLYDYLNHLPWTHPVFLRFIQDWNCYYIHFNTMASDIIPRFDETIIDWAEGYYSPGMWVTTYLQSQPHEPYEVAPDDVWLEIAKSLR